MYPPTRMVESTRIGETALGEVPEEHPTAGKTESLTGDDIVGVAVTRTVDRDTRAMLGQPKMMMVMIRMISTCQLAVSKVVRVAQQMIAARANGMPSSMSPIREITESVAPPV